MGIRIVTPPVTEPLSLADAKAHLRVDSDDEDALISGLITAARLTAERQCWRQFAPATLCLSLDTFPAGPVIYLPRPPLVSVTEIRYVDLAGDAQTLAAANYYVDASGEPGRVMLKSGHSWPVTNLQPGCVQIDFVAGAASLPADLKAALLLIVGQLFAHREAVTAGTINELPLGVSALLSLHRFRDQRIVDQFREACE